jgi:hypothetical protein
MNRFRLLAIATTLMASLTLFAQQTAAPPPPSQEQAQTQNAAPHALPTVDQHIKVLSEKLDLTADQQTKIRPIIEHMQDESQKVIDDTTLSPEARHAKMKTIHEKATNQTRPYLSDDQKKKLDELEQEPHHHPHAQTNTAPPQPQ